MKKTKVLEDLLNKESIESENVKSIINHSKKVRDIALEICDEINNQKKATIISKNDQKLIKIAALFHDVRKYNAKNIKRKNHNVKGANYINKQRIDFLNSFSDKEIALICLMVRWHRGKGYKDFKYSKKKIRMIEIVRIADKISKIYKKPIEDCAYSIVKNISSLQNKKVKKVASIVLLERVKMLNDEV